MKTNRHAALAMGFFLSGFATRQGSAADMTVYVIGFQGEFGTLDLSNPDDITFNLNEDTGIRTAGMGFTSSGSLYLLNLNFTASHLLSIDPTTENTLNLGTLTDTAIGATIGPDGQTMYAIDRHSPAGLYSEARSRHSGSPEDAPPVHLSAPA